MLGVQTFSVCCLFLWGLIITYPIIWIVNKLTPIRLDPHDEVLGCDLVEHNMGDEYKKMLPSINEMQMTNTRLAGAQVSLTLAPPPNPYYNETYKEFDTPGKRKTFHLNHGYERDNAAHQQNSNERL